MEARSLGIEGSELEANAGRGTAETAACEWRQAHTALAGLARRRAELDCVEAGCLLRAERLQVHRHLGFGSFAEYVERLLGYSVRTLEEKLRVARALERLPEIRCALASGAITWSAVRELTRVASESSEGVWLEAAEGL